MFKRSSREWGFELLRSLAFYYVYIVLSLILSGLFILCCTGIMKSLHIPKEPIFAVSTLGLIFSSYSFARAFELYDLRARRAFIDKMGDKYSLVRDLKISFSDPLLGFKTIVQLGIILSLAFILPYEFGYGFLMQSLSGLVTLEEMQLYFLKSAIVLPTLLLIILLAKTSAHKWWIIARTAERERMDTLERPNLRLLLEILKISGIYTVSFATLPTVIMLIVSLILTLGLFSVQPWIIPVLLVLLTVPFLIRAAVTLLIRYRFWRRLKSTLHRCGYELTDVVSPIFSSVRARRGATFVMSLGDRTYAVKLLSSVKRRKPVFLNSEGFFTVKNTVSFMKITFFHIMTDVEYDFESEYTKIAVFSPMPRRVFLNWGRTDTAFDDGDGGGVPTVATVRAAAMSGGRSSGRGIHGPGYVSDIDRGIIKPFETGERIGGVKFFTPAGFISAVDNDCLDR